MENPAFGLQRIFFVLMFTCLAPIIFYLGYSYHEISSCHCARVRADEAAVEKPRPRNYSVISATVPNFLNQTMYFQDGVNVQTDRAWGYIYNLPLTAMTWNKVGFTPIVIMTVDFKKTHRFAIRAMRYVEKTLRQMNATVIYFDLPSHMMIRMSQVLRLVTGEFDFLNDDDFVMTSDSDLWPLNPRRYVMNAGKKILVTFADCCGKFMFNNKRYTQYPLSNIAMTKKLWRKIFSNNIVGKYSGNVYTYDNVRPLVERLNRFGKIWINSTDMFTPDRDSMFWYLDQHYASVHIGNYVDEVDNSTLHARKGFECPRVSTGNWHRTLLKEKHDCFSDAHVYKNSPWFYWREMKMLLTRVLDKNDMLFLERYHKTFVNIYEGFIDL